MNQMQYFDEWRHSCSAHSACTWFQWHPHDMLQEEEQQQTPILCNCVTYILDSADKSSGNAGGCPLLQQLLSVEQARYPTKQMNATLSWRLQFWHARLGCFCSRVLLEQHKDSAVITMFARNACNSACKRLLDHQQSIYIYRSNQIFEEQDLAVLLLNESFQLAQRVLHLMPQP